MPPQAQASSPGVRLPSFLDPHMFWAAGHGVMLICGSYVLLQTLFFRATPTFLYRLGFLGTLVSYAIVISKSLGRPQLTPQWAQRAYVDENVQYGVLALYWAISRPSPFAIFPFVVFALFHTLTFVRTNVLSRFIPRQPQPAAGGQARPPPQGLESLSRTIQVLVKNNHSRAMQVVAYEELVLLIVVAFGAITFRSSFISPFFLAHFIRLRYHASPFTRDAINDLTTRIDAKIGNNNGALGKGWQTVKRVVGTWGGGRLLSAQAQAQGQGRGAAAGGAAQERRNQ